jgi:ureidoglycolate lyase
MTSPDELTHYLTAEPLVPSTFERFGTIISTEVLTPMGSSQIYGGAVEGFVGPIVEADHPPIEILLSRTRLRDFRVEYFERHHGMTQLYVPLNGHTFVWVLAPPDAREVDGIPAIDEIRAFILPGDAAVKMHRGTWHETPFALRPGGVFFVISEQPLNRSVRADRKDNGEIDNAPIVERRNVTLRTGITLRVRLP